MELKCLVLTSLPIMPVLRAQVAAPTVQVTGTVKQTLNLTADDYQGVWLHEVQKRAEVVQLRK